MPAHHRDRHEGRGQSALVHRIVDWVVPAALVAATLVAAGLGLVLRNVVDRELSAELVADIEGKPPLVSESVLADAIYNLGVWGAGGLGLLAVVFATGGIGFGYYRARLGETEGLIETKSAVFTGAVVTAVLSFVPFSSLLGGGVVGYLRRHEGDDAARLGVVSGVLASVPRVLVGGSLALGALAAGAMPVAGVFAVSLGVGVSAILTLSGLGAYFGTRIGE